MRGDFEPSRRSFYRYRLEHEEGGENTPFSTANIDFCYLFRDWCGVDSM